MAAKWTKQKREAAVVAALLPRDVADLKAYFRRSSSAGGSNYCVMEAQMAMFGKGSKPCRACGGSSHTGKPGCGFRIGHRKRKKPRPPTRYDIEMANWLGKKATLLPPGGDQLCGVCQGTGWVERKARERRSHRKITAFPTGSTIDRSASFSSIENHAVMLGRVTAALNGVANAAPDCLDVLELWFSPGGGRLECLWELTRAGKTMLRRHKGLSPGAAFENERLFAEKAGTADHPLFKAADAEAQELLAGACEAFARAVGTELPEPDAPTKRRRATIADIDEELEKLSVAIRDTLGKHEVAA